MRRCGAQRRWGTAPPGEAERQIQALFDRRGAPPERGGARLCRGEPACRRGVVAVAAVGLALGALQAASAEGAAGRELRARKGGGGTGRATIVMGGGRLRCGARRATTVEDVAGGVVSLQRRAPGA